MSTIEIQKKTKNIIDNFSKDNQSDFIFELLRAYGVPKSTITRLKKGDLNRSKTEGEILFAKKVIFRTESNNNLLSAIDDITKDEKITKFAPRFAILTDHDYTHLVARDLKLGKNLDIALNELAQHYDFFLPLAGSEVYNASNDNEADRNAAYKMAVLYDHLREDNPDIYKSAERIHQLNVFLSRLLFCFFAEDTGIFPIESIFTDTLVQHTDNSGQDTHNFLDNLFQRFNTPDNLPEFNSFPAFLQEFPYVNGGLFRDKISSPKFSSKSRKILIELGELQWKDINPDIFGSMIQAVTTGEDRSKLGQHYTSVPNILKLIKPLFLDELYEALDEATTIKQLYQLQNRLAEIKIFDPACGSGNFLIITYKELRVLEIEVVKKIIELSDENTLGTYASQIKISQFYGIEIDDFSHEMAILSLWLAEHQMNIIFQERLFDYAVIANILPLKEIGKIHHANATRVDWKGICPISSNDEVYVIGNPPYYGYSRQTNRQKEDLEFVLNKLKGYKKLDYIACWFYLASKYIEKTTCKFAFVTTNSISQGEQVGLFWNSVLEKEQEIDFAYQSFKWKNNAKGNAGVVVVIIAIRNKSDQPKYIINNGFKQKVNNVSPYLTNSVNLIVRPRQVSISDFPNMLMGSKVTDGGNLLLSEIEKKDIINNFPSAKLFIKNYIGASEFIRGKSRYCIYVPKNKIKAACEINDFRIRFEKVRSFRSKSKKKSTKQKADTPYFFDEDKYKNGEFILVPETSSENREYIPTGFFDGTIVPSNATRIIYDVEPFMFAVLSSKMHMVWIKAVGGRLKTDYRYSSTLCYNTFPFPPIDVKQKENLTQYVFDILEARANHAGKTMAWMYDPDTMPADLKQAHQALDKAVEQCYRLAAFDSDSERLEYLFKLYEKMIAEEKTEPKKPKKKVKKLKKIISRDLV